MLDVGVDEVPASAVAAITPRNHPAAMAVMVQRTKDVRLTPRPPFPPPLLPADDDDDDVAVAACRVILVLFVSSSLSTNR